MLSRFSLLDYSVFRLMLLIAFSVQLVHCEYSNRPANATQSASSDYSISLDSKIAKLIGTIDDAIDDWVNWQKSIQLKNNTRNINDRSLDIEPRDGGGGKRKSKGKKTDLMSKILPMLAIPFLVSSSMIPMMLMSLKIMLLKSLFVGKMAMVLLAINAFWRINNQGGVYSHNIHLTHESKELMHEHYGYNEGEEYGAYINKRRRR